MKVLKENDIYSGKCEKCGAEIECEWKETQQLYYDSYDGSNDEAGRGVKCPTCKDEYITVKPKNNKERIKNRLTISIHDLSELSRKVGYANHKCNVSPLDEGLRDEYEDLRADELNMMKHIVEEFSK